MIAWIITTIIVEICVDIRFATHKHAFILSTICGEWIRELLYHNHLAGGSFKLEPRRQSSHDIILVAYLCYRTVWVGRDECTALI